MKHLQDVAVYKSFGSPSRRMPKRKLNGRNEKPRVERKYDVQKRR